MSLQQDALRQLQYLVNGLGSLQPAIPPLQPVMTPAQIAALFSKPVAPKPPDDPQLLAANQRVRVLEEELDKLMKDRVTPAVAPAPVEVHPVVRAIRQARNPRHPFGSVFDG